MTQIISLMQELNLNDEIISNTVSKITLICCKNDYPIMTGSKVLYQPGSNGNGNGDGNN